MTELVQRVKQGLAATAYRGRYDNSQINRPRFVEMSWDEDAATRFIEWAEKNGIEIVLDDEPVRLGCNCIVGEHDNTLDAMREHHPEISFPTDDGLAHFYFSTAGDR